MEGFNCARVSLLSAYEPVAVAGRSNPTSGMVLVLSGESDRGRFRGFAWPDAYTALRSTLRNIYFPILIR